MFQYIVICFSWLVRSKTNPMSLCASNWNLDATHGEHKYITRCGLSIYIYLYIYMYIYIYICMLKAIIPNLIGHFLLVESLINPQEIVM